MVKNTTDQHAEPAGRPKRPPTPASWKPGQTGNAKGRPRLGSALTDAIREQADPSELVAIALKLAREGKPSEQLGALNWLRDSGFTRPAERHEVGPPGSVDANDYDFDGMTLEDAVALDELLGRVPVRALPEPSTTGLGPVGVIAK